MSQGPFAESCRFPGLHGRLPQSLHNGPLKISTYGTVVSCASTVWLLQSATSVGGSARRQANATQ